MKKNKIAPLNIKVAKKEKKARFLKACDVYAWEISKDCPVLVQRGAVLHDNISGNKFLQLKLSNAGDKEIKSVYIRFNCLDDIGDLSGEEVTASYIDIACKHGECFGTKTLILIPSVSKHFRFTEIKIAYTDGTNDRFSKENFQVIPEAKSLKESIDTEYHAYLDMQKELRVQPEQISEEIARCICGGLIIGDGVCANCGRDFKKALQDSTEENITQAYYDYLGECQKRIWDEKHKKSISKKEEISTMVAGIAFILYGMYQLFLLLIHHKIHMLMLFISTILLVIALFKKEQGKTLWVGLCLLAIGSAQKIVTVHITSLWVIMVLIRFLAILLVLVYTTICINGKNSTIKNRLSNYLGIASVIFLLYPFTYHPVLDIPWGIGMSLLTYWIKITTK